MLINVTTPGTKWAKFMEWADGTVARGGGDVAAWCFALETVAAQHGSTGLTEPNLVCCCSVTVHQLL
jgi:hypothetical protein